MFANRKYEQFSYPKNPKTCDPILVTLLKMQRHYSQSSRENSTPFSGTSQFASYKNVSAPPPPRTGPILSFARLDHLVVKSSFKRRAEVFAFYIID